MEIQLWREILNPYELAVKELVVKFEHIIKEYRDMGIYCPIERVVGRVKTISSILSKARKKDIPMSDITNRIEDIAGIRIICQFVEDIYQVVEFIRNRTDMEIIEEIDYIKDPKLSGYRSYHIIVKYEVQSSFGNKIIKVEIQLRTLAMNFWAVIEHSLQYKYGKKVPEHVAQRIRNSAQAVVSLDNEMASIRNEIMDAQGSFNQKATLVSGILSTIRNLYRVADTEIMNELQNEFFRIYNDGDISELEEFYHRVDKVAEKHQFQNI